MYKELSNEDITKLHEEVNLYISQRLVITTTTITVFGAIASLFLAQISDSLAVEPTALVEAGGQYLSLLLPSASMVILGIMLWYCQSVVQQMHVISTYLTETKSSDWEGHYHKFAKAKHLAPSLESLPLVVFAALGLSSMCLSFAVYFIANRDPNLQVSTASTATFVGTATIYWSIFANFWVKRNPRTFREKATRRWQIVLAEQAEEDFYSNRAIAKWSEASFAAVWNNPDDDIYNDL